ncbi:DUF192 domain-containing protein [Candidatus Nomurabacteria bacterium]|nr:DUF192 domain-containing protein [Candidatus Nomurabacteria bacterium]
MPRRASLAVTTLVPLILAAIFFHHPPRQTIILDGKKIDLELAQTPEEMTRGLSGREGLPEDSGMLFVYPEDTVPAFWMKDMRFPIDIIWLDKNWMVVGIEKNLLPSTYPQTFSPPKPIRYVLEKNPS